MAGGLQKKKREEAGNPVVGKKKKKLPGLPGKVKKKM